MNAQLAHITASSAVSTSMEDFHVAVTQATCSNQIGEPVLVSQLLMQGVFILHIIMTAMFKLDINECSLNTTNWCDQLCINTNGSFQCSCNAGFSLSSNGRSCLDINECTAGAHNCQQRCININGGFSCDCDSGYQLNFDQNSCSGKPWQFCTTTTAIHIDFVRKNYFV